MLVQLTLTQHRQPELRLDQAVEQLVEEDLSTSTRRSRWSASSGRR
jgi:hypothetical protein